MMKVSDEPFCLEEVQAVLEIYEGLHGTDLGRLRFRKWLEDKRVSEEAYEFLATLYRETKR